jgi:hypothetical protein
MNDPLLSHMHQRRYHLRPNVLYGIKSLHPPYWRVLSDEAVEVCRPHVFLDGDGLVEVEVFVVLVHEELVREDVLVVKGTGGAEFVESVVDLGECVGLVVYSFFADEGLARVLGEELVAVWSLEGEAAFHGDTAGSCCSFFSGFFFGIFFCLLLFLNLNRTDFILVYVM